MSPLLAQVHHQFGWWLGTTQDTGPPQTNEGNLHHQDSLTHYGLGDFNVILDECFSSQLQSLMTEISAVKLPSEKCH